MDGSLHASIKCIYYTILHHGIKQLEKTNIAVLTGWSNLCDVWTTPTFNQSSMQYVLFYKFLHKWVKQGIVI